MLQRLALAIEGKLLSLLIYIL